MKISYFMILICFAIYDQIAKSLSDYSLNLSIFYHVSYLSFISFVIIDSAIKTRNKDRLLLLILSLPFLVRILLNLICINKDYDFYMRIVNQPLIDFLTWSVLIISVIILMPWENLKLYRK